MAAVLFHERHRIREIEEDANAIRLVRREINNIHRHITDLALSGESVMAWEQADYESYHEDRLNTDTLLQNLQLNHGDFVLSDQIDTLRNLLEDKETHLLHIMQAYHRQEIADSLLLHRLPVETERVTNPRTITQKKKGIAGFFGKKETVQVPPSADAIRSLNERLITIQEERIRNIDAYSDSLRLQNKELNRKLHMLINTLNNHTQEVFLYREKHIEVSHELSTRIVTGLIIAALILLAIFYMVIQQDLKRDTKLRLKMEEIINKNHELLETRKNIILTISHDIRAPLNIINSSAELAADTRDRKRRNRHLTNIGIVSRHILHLLNNLFRRVPSERFQGDLQQRAVQPERFVGAYRHRFFPCGEQQEYPFPSRFQGYGCRASRRRGPYRANHRQPAGECRQVYGNGNDTFQCRL